MGMNTACSKYDLLLLLSIDNVLLNFLNSAFISSNKACRVLSKSSDTSSSKLSVCPVGMIFTSIGSLISS